MKRLFAVTVAVFMSASILGACGGDKKEAIAYRPIAYGENNQCYYVHDPVEAQLLMEQGLCERSWAPVVMPLYWHQMYYPYYSSPSYYGTYVPRATRTVFVEREKSWGAANKGAIAATAKKATYLASNGKKVAASKIGATKYGGGARFGAPGTKFGGGARTATNKQPSPSAKTPSPSAKKTPAPKADAPKSTPAKPSAPKSSPPKVSPPKSSGGSKSFGGGSRSGGFSGGTRSGGGSFGGGSRSGGFSSGRR